MKLSQILPYLQKCINNDGGVTLEDALVKAEAMRVKDERSETIRRAYTLKNSVDGQVFLFKKDLTAEERSRMPTLDVIYHNESYDDYGRRCTQHLRDVIAYEAQCLRRRPQENADV